MVSSAPPKLSRVRLERTARKARDSLSLAQKVISAFGSDIGQFFCFVIYSFGVCFCEFEKIGVLSLHGCPLLST